MCSTRTSTRRFHPKWRRRPAPDFVCASRDILSKSKHKPLKRSDHTGTWRIRYAIILALIMAACVALWPHDDDMIKIVDNNLRWMSNSDVIEALVQPSIGDGSNVDESYEIQQTDAERAVDGSSYASESRQIIDESTQEVAQETHAPLLVDSGATGRVPLRQRQIDPNSLHKITAEEAGEPFYRRWPQADMPGYAVKQVYYDVPREDSICFVHVGKTAGSTVGCYLGFAHHCNNTTMLEGNLPKITTHLFHNDVDNCYDDASYYLFVVRDPIERARSAFYYNRPDDDCNDPDWQSYETYYKECPFFTFEAMIQNGLAVDGSASEHCKTIAKEAISGTGELAPIHIYYNYQYYLEALLQNSRILVIRNEHMIEDWNDLEKQLGGNQETLLPEDIENNNANIWLDPSDMKFSDDSKEIMCDALCNEIKVYKNILQMAENLNQSQVDFSIEELKAKCPVEASDEYTCREALPDISQKVIDNRGPPLS